jgi:diaminopimelate decarboxylase
VELTQTSVALPAIDPAWVAQVQQDPTLLRQIANAVGGPFHVLSPEQFTINLRLFVDAIAAAGVDGTVYFGKKANKAGCWPKECAQANCGVDVASAPELADAMAHGIRGQDLVITGPAKPTELVWLAMRHGALIAVDALDELDMVIRLTHSVGRARILLRVLPPANPMSRFGLSDDELEHALQRCVQECGNIHMEGFSFHLTGYDVSPRAWQAAQLVDRCIAARQMGLAATSVSIGGGFAVSYVAAEDWQTFLANYDDSWFHTRKSFRGFYPYHQQPAGASMLSAILNDGVTPGHADLAAKLTQTRTRLLVEPGRALLDGCGFTVFPVLGFKLRRDYGFITVGGLSLSLSEQWFDSEYLPDPVLWPPESSGTPASACVGGSSCLETDMLTWRLVRLPREPRRGDLLIYPNTAGYQMDSNESEFHQLALPTKIVVTTDNTRLRWHLA